MSRPTASVSIIILSSRSSKPLRACLASLAAGTLLPGEVVVLVNEGMEEITELLESWNGPFPLVSVPGTGGGFAESRNLGVQSATQPHIAFLDDDCLADGPWLERLMAALADHDAAAGVVLPATELDTPNWFTPDLNWLAGLSPPGIFSLLGGRTILPQTANLAFRRTAWVSVPFQQIGGRLTEAEAEQNYRVGREDAQWWRDARRSGLRCAVVHRAIVWHDIDSSRFDKEKLEERARNDGRAHWRRAPSVEDFDQAAAEVSGAPVSIVQDLFEPGLTPVQAVERHRMWMVRQWELMREAVDDPRAGVAPTRRSAHLARGGWRAVSGQVKRAGREVAAALHHRFKAVRPIPTRDRPPARVLVVCYDFLGDAILMMPMLEDLRAGFPDAHVTLMTGEVAAPLFRGSSCINKLRVLPSGMGPHSPQAMRRTWNEVRAARPDVIVVTYFHEAPPLPLFAATSAPVICWDRDHGMRQQLWHRLAAHVVSKSMSKFEPSALQDLLAPMRIRTRTRRPSHTPNAAAREKAEAVMKRCGLQAGRFAIIHLDGEETHWKFWPADRWARVARHLFEKHSLRTAFAGTRRGKRFYEFMELPPGCAVSVHGMLDSGELAALLQQARVALGADSGPQHLAQSVGTPTVILFGATEEHRWGPMPRVQDDADRPLPFKTVRGAPADWHPDECRGFAPNEALLRISPESVIEALDSLLAT